MSRLTARICTPPPREKYTPPLKSIDTPQGILEKFSKFFSINFTHQLYFYNKINWNKSIFKKLACGGQYCISVFIYFQLIRIMHFHPRIWIPSQLSLLLSHSISFASLAALGWGHQSTFCLSWIVSGKLNASEEITKGEKIFSWKQCVGLGK